jgi:hypothetical protein
MANASPTTIVSPGTAGDILNDKAKYASCIHEGLKSIGESLGIEIASHKGKVLTPIVWDKFSNNCPDSKVWVEIDMYVKPGYHGGGGEVFATRTGDSIYGKTEEGQVLGVLGVHRHTCDEAFFCFGSNPDNCESLGGEFEFYLGAGEDAERYRFTKNTCVYVPAGVFHNPQGAIRVDDPTHPIIEVVIMLSDNHGRGMSEYAVDAKGEFVFPPGFVTQAR